MPGDTFNPSGARTTAWWMTTGESGMRRQAKGLAEAVAGANAVERNVGMRPPLSLLPGRWTPAPFLGLDPAKDRLEPPWPDLLVSCGRRSTALSIEVRRRSGKRTLTVCIQAPRTDPGCFDLVVAMEHDRVRGPNVMHVPTTLHDLTPERLRTAGEVWRPRLHWLPRPLVGVALGGWARRYGFGLREAERLIVGLDRLRAEAGAGVAITASRRTPEPVRALFRARYAGADDVGLWLEDGGENPYLGLLATADRLIATSDSVSMVSEMLAAGPPVELLDLGGARHVSFVQNLVDRGWARRFTGDPSPPPPGGVLNTTEAVAARVRAMLEARA